MARAIPCALWHSVPQEFYMGLHPGCEGGWWWGDAKDAGGYHHQESSYLCFLYLHIRSPRFLHIRLAWNRHLRFWVTLVETASKVPLYRLRHALNCCAWSRCPGHSLEWLLCPVIFNTLRLSSSLRLRCKVKVMSSHSWDLSGSVFPNRFPSFYDLIVYSFESKQGVNKMLIWKKLNKKTYKFTVSHIKGFTIVHGFERWAFIFVGANKILSDIQNRISCISHSSSTLSTFQINKLKNFRIKGNIQCCWKWTTPTNFLNTMDFLLYCAESLQSCPTLCNPMDHLSMGILQARILEWVAVSSSRRSSYSSYFLPYSYLFFASHSQYFNLRISSYHTTVFQV